MASCPKCGRAKIKKTRAGERACPRHGPIPDPLTETQGPTP